MIGRLAGKLQEKHPEGIVLDVSGVGYEVRVPLSTFLDLPDEGKTLRLWIHTYVREDALHLYGFLAREERSAFLLLLGISGVGPRLALALLSGLPVSRLVHPGATADIVFLANFLFLGGNPPPCRAAADVNGDGEVPGSTTDIVFLANFLFLGGDEPPAPGPRECGSGTKADLKLGCETPPVCGVASQN